MINGLIIDKIETKRWYLNDQFHREDGPAVEYANGDKYWYLGDQHHRIDGPAIEHADGTKIWYQNGQLHREDGPAVEYANGYKAWHFKGKKIDCSSQQKFEQLIKLKSFW